MKVIVDLINKSFKVLENEKNIYVGNNNADVLKLYCYNGGYHLENEFVSITGLLSNGRKIGPFTTDSAYDEEYIDGKLHIVANFTLTKQNGFTLSEGQLNITVWHNKTNDSGAIVSKQAIGNLVFNVIKTANVDDNIIITDSSGDVIYNFKLEIENIQSAVNSVNSSFVKFKQHTEESIMRLEDNKADLEVMWDAFDNYSEQIPYGDRKFAWLLGFTGESLVIDMINELNSRDLFVDDKGKFWVKIGLENPTVIEDIRITKQKKANGYLTGYGINSIIRSGTTIRIFMKSVAKDSTMTINEFIDLHKQVAIKEEVPTKVSQLENDADYVTLETLNDTKDELREYTDEKVADLVNSAPETLDTLGEIANALKENDNVVEALNNAISTKADISYVDEKIASAGVPSDLLNRVETLETNKANKTEIPTKTSQLTNDSAFINQTQLDEALANVGGGGSVSLYKHTISIECYNFLEGEAYFDLTFYNLNSKSILEGAQDGAEASDKLFNYLYGKGKFDISTDYTDTNIATLFEAIYEDGVKKFDIYVPENATNNVAKYNIDELVINDYEPVLIGTASGGTGSGASGNYVPVKEYIYLHDNEDYNVQLQNLIVGDINWYLDTMPTLKFYDEHYDTFLNNKHFIIDMGYYLEEHHSELISNQNFEQNGSMIYYSFSFTKNSKIEIIIPEEFNYKMYGDEKQLFSHVLHFSWGNLKSLAGANNSGMLDGLEYQFEEYLDVYLSSHDMRIIIDIDNEGAVSVNTTPLNWEI